jgi:putative DNA primase/helicase
MQGTESLAIIGRLDGNPNNGMCHCPCHDDSKASLRVSAASGGKVLLHCKAGCSQEVLVEWCKQHGLWPTSKRVVNFAERREQRQMEQAENSGRFYNAYAVLFAALRYQGDNPDAAQNLIPYFTGRGIEQVPPNALYLPQKEMGQLDRRHPELSLRSYPAMLQPVVNSNGHLQGALVTFLTIDGKQNLRVDKQAIRRTLGLPKGGFVPVGWPDPDHPLLVAEGVEDAAALAQDIGYPAIASLSCSNMEVLNPPPCARLFIGNDNDKSGAGLKAAQTLASRHGNAAIVSPPDKFKDWNEALQAADDKALGHYRRMFKNADPFEGERKVLVLSMQEVLAMEFTPREFLLEPWLETESLAMLHAARGVGKTRLMMAIAYAVANGQAFLNWNCGRAARVLYVDGEMPGRLLQKRLQLLGPCCSELMLVSRDILLRAGTQLPDLAEPEGRAFLDKVIAEDKSELVVLDSLSTLIRSGMENEAESWVPIQDWMMQHRFRGRSIVLVHHEGKSGKPRGSSKREDVLDTIVRLQEEEDANGQAVMKLSFTKRREFAAEAAPPMLLRLSLDTGTAVWSYENEHDDKRRAQILELHGQGKSQTDIAKEVKLSQSQVSRILAESVNARKGVE